MDFGDMIIEAAQCGQAHAEVRGFSLDFRPAEVPQDTRDGDAGFIDRIAELFAVKLVRIFVFKKSMQKRCVRGVNADLQRL